MCLYFSNVIFNFFCRFFSDIWSDSHLFEVIWSMELWWDQISVSGSNICEWIIFILHSFWVFSHTFMSTDTPIFVLDLEQSSFSINKKRINLLAHTFEEEPLAIFELTPLRLEIDALKMSYWAVDKMLTFSQLYICQFNQCILKDQVWPLKNL